MTTYTNDRRITSMPYYNFVRLIGYLLLASHVITAQASNATNCQSIDNQIAYYSKDTQFISANILRNKLTKNKSLVVVSGIDPRRPNIHLGHTLVLDKLRQFQDCGHVVHWIMCEFTAKFGDPSWEMKTRSILSTHEIKNNAIIN